MSGVCLAIDNYLPKGQPNKSMHANCYRPFLQRLRAGKEMGICGEPRQPAIV
jgi:hypothetical protein